MKNNDSEPLQTLTIPDHVVLDHILPNLPVKSLIRFKSVCKTWHSFISTTQFAKSHLQFSSSRNYFLIHDDSLRTFLLPYEEHGLKDFTVELEDEFVNGRNIEIMGSCNGLVCLHVKFNQDGFLVLWNPAIHQWRKIDNPDQGYPHFYGFGYASNIDDYKLVSLFGDRDADENNFLDIFSLRAGTWTRMSRMKDYGLDVGPRLLSRGMLIDEYDTLYWYYRDYDNPENTRIVGFHLVSEQFEGIPMDQWVRAYDWVNLYVVSGCLSLQCFRNNGPSDVWVLKQHGNWDSWEKLYSIPLALRLLDFSATGKCLLRKNKANYVKQLMFVDLRQEDLESAQVSDCYYGISEMIHYIESLISPFGTTKIDEGVKNEVNK